MAKKNNKKKIRLPILLGIKKLIAVFREINWPTTKDLVVYSIAVLIISVIITAYLVGLDNLFNFIRLNIIFK